MKFFSGFALHEDKHFFEDFISESEYAVAGFSYGAIKAIEYALTCNERIDTLYLFSPAFFQDKKSSFKKLQLRAFSKDSNAYIKTFIENCFEPYAPLHVNTTNPDISELEALLYYEYSLEDLQKLVDKGIHIEIYIGGKDAIVDALHVKEFFLPFATTYFIKEANHFLSNSVIKGKL